MTTNTLLRQRGHHDSSRVGMVELFFDLVFVFAVTQLSHTLLADLTAGSAMKTSLLLVAVWWIWIFTSWVTNWLDPDRFPVRICLFVLMLAALFMAAAIPHAFDKTGLVFAVAYVSMQVGRTAFFLWAIRTEPLNLRRNFLRILIWLAFSGVFWIAGGLAEEEFRLAWWAIALAIEIVSPYAYFWVPGLGRSSTADWSIDGSHLAERCGLFIIIALGESLLVTGATFAEQAWTADALLALLAAVFGSIAMWWIYFDTGAERAHHRIEHSDDPGRQGRLAYTYLHTFIVAGIIVCAVADELVLAHPDHADAAAVTAILGGPALFLFGVMCFKWVTNDRRGPPLSHMASLLMLGLLVVPASGHAFSALQLGGLTTGILSLVAIWESFALRRP
ncbi:low temperature requirement protein A [Arenimonas oryziterrae]|uniref:Low temperature requirement protein A n=1 Tax=Arenimonas oryziterrae DSM 21050 = YC6267 TaxID=1121015 RepID=A0A091AWF3_9GAMM|nr:low temperature requirement protein A [Arenimonas oryziterrae]KFN42964.1 hypothetical protein N789_12635 [Arenimonas oryziterrae DSM 21050 = YC6267]